MPDTAPVDDGSGSPGDGAGLDTSVANVARVYDYLLGGKDNYEADREAAVRAMAVFPGIAATVRANRAFLGRAVRYLAGEAGIRQFLDIGPGLPTSGSTHEIAQSIAPECRIVYVDNDPVVIAHARALLTSSPEGETAYLRADLRETGKILAAAGQTLDFTQPVAIMLVAVLHFIPGAEAYEIAAKLAAATAAGSFLTISHVAKDIEAETMGEVIGQANQLVDQQTTPRTRDEVTRFFEGLDLVGPGVVALDEWRPDSELTAATRAAGWCGVAGRR
ncbi:MAG: SAM-dependent methyltransferase [Nocardiopsaceae bacterium]|jgi:O-methyltransferase involved in polyketide biosynthesis|nr:SAM-dependent methyltransferase [Nocardiopsaceae bacterium]